MTNVIETLGTILNSGDFKPEEAQVEDYGKLGEIVDKNSISLQEQRYLQTTTSLPIDPNELEELLEFQSTVEQFIGLIVPLSEYLSKFNAQLVDLSKELESLKSKSVILSSNLKQRQELENKYVPIVSDLIIPPDVIKDIYNNDITERWCENLQFLKDKLEIIDKYEKMEEYKDMKSIKELRALIDDLQLKLIQRIRDFLVVKIRKLREIGTSSQVIQQELIQVKEIYPFLLKHYSSLALEIKQAYIYTMRWYYSAHFKRYLQSLSRLKLHQFDKNNLIGIQSQSFFNKKSGNSSFDNYTIGKRANIIKAEDPTVLLGQIAEHNQVIFNMEIGFRSFNLALIDNGSVEYLFLLEFFQMTGSEILGLFEQIFKPTLDLGIEYTKHLIDNTFDIFGVLILIRLSQSLIYELQTRRIPVIEDYFNLQMIILWPQFQKLIDLNVENMKRTSLKSSSITEIQSNKPHPLTVQFTNLVYGFLKLTLFEAVHVNDAQQEPLFNSLQRLNSEYEIIMTKLGKMSKSGELFLYNNYSYVLGMLNDCEGSLAQTEIEHYRKLTVAYEVNK